MTTTGYDQSIRNQLNNIQSDATNFEKSKIVCTDGVINMNSELTTIGSLLDMSGHKIQNVLDPTAGQDVISLSYLQNNNYTQTQTTALTLNQFQPPTGNINMQNQRITNLSVPISSSDAVSQSFCDGRYYAQTTKLNAITAPNASVDMNSQRIINCAVGVGPNDCVVVSQLSSGSIQPRIQSSDVSSTVVCSDSGVQQVTCSDLQINGKKSSQSELIFGQTLQFSTSQLFTLQFGSPSVVKSNYPCMGFSSFNTFFTDLAYNQNSSQIQIDTTGFRILAPAGRLLKVQIRFALYNYQCNSPVTLHVGLHSSAISNYLIESIQSYESTMLESYKVITSSFIMKCDGQNSKYTPFYSYAPQNQCTTGLGNQYGKTSISLEFFPFISM